MRARLPVGDWRPGEHNAALLIVQLAVLLAAALRALDYLGDRTPTSTALAAAEAAIPLSVGGGVMLGSTVLALVGLAGRWAAPIVIAHLSVACGYFWIGIGLMIVRGIDLDVRGVLSLVGIAGGLWLMLRPERQWVRLLSVPLLVFCQIVLAGDLGVDYRTATGQLTAATIHVVLAVGTLVLWFRQRVRPIAEARAGLAADG